VTYENLRRSDSKRVSQRLAAAEKAISDLEQTVLLWSDSVRANAERIHGADAPSEVLWKVPEYAASLDAISEVQAAKDRLAAALTAFSHAEGRWE
jgi:hypothetical protein